MKKGDFACFFNSPSLGGAERSFCLQARDLKRSNEQSSIRFYIPYIENLDEAKKLKNFLLECGFRGNEIFYYRYHRYLYEFSRGGTLGNFTIFPRMLLGLMLTMKELSKLQVRNPDTWWVGGNKVGFVVFILGFLSSYKGRLLWHFRDYPYAKGIFKILPFLFKLPHSFRLDAVGNSFDVAKAIKKSPFPFKNIYTLYNPVGDFKFNPKHEGELVFGTASMLAPWKGVHSIIQFVHRHKARLKEMGYKNFYIYGDQIYKTKGAHSEYKESLKTLVKEFDDGFIVFKGLKGPQEIYENLDVFIHSSLKPEPFGRVIPEAMNAGTLVVSTGLGGSGELFEDGISGLQYLAFDDTSLMRALEQGVTERRFSIIQKGKERSSELGELYKEQLLKVF